MQNLFLVDGASGTGKSDLLKHVRDFNADDVTYVTKLTTRPPRLYEKSDASLMDLKMVSEAEFEQANPEYSYTYAGARYGFHRRELDTALMRYDNVFVIVRDVRLIKRLAEDYSFLNVIPLFIHTDETKLVARLQREGLTEEQIRFRLDRTERASGDYYMHPTVYKEVLINNSSKGRFEGLIQSMMDKYKCAPQIDPFKIAVMMSFDPNDKRLEEYYAAMTEAVASLPGTLHCTRVDKVPGSPKISEESTRLIEEARCVIVDLTNNKQNVYYELGFAHGRGKTCIMTAEEHTELKFYSQERKVLFYSSAWELRKKLRVELLGVLRYGPTRAVAKK